MPPNAILNHMLCTAILNPGAYTTVSALGTFILAMLAYPEVQKTAQAEIDSLTGGKYLPSFEGEVSLPYISALVKEVMRWENRYPGYSQTTTSIVATGFLQAPLLSEMHGPFSMMSGCDNDDNDDDEIPPLE
ncbi:hypothetical protein B0H14DRAFT_3441547 [Mycena olivaceomarginata]|nr:hypothetical protein B0H14DRAFT_3441547 [Mycena olivaceomarginata]